MRWARLPTIFSKVTNSMELVAGKGGSVLTDATTVPALSPPALSIPLGDEFPVCGQSQLPLSVGAIGDVGGPELGATNTLGGATIDELRLAIIGRVRGLCAELLRPSRPNGVVAIYLATKAAAQEHDLDYITRCINYTSNTKTPEQSVAFLRRCGANLCRASGQDKVEVKVPAEDGGSTGDETGGANSNKSAEGEGGGNQTPIPPNLPKPVKVFSRLDVHPLASL